MASASVVGQHPGPHRLDSEPQLFFHKLTASGKKKITRISSLEMMFRKSSVKGSVKTRGEPTVSAAPVESLNHSLSPGQQGETTGTGGGKSGEGCGTQPAQTPRSPDRDREEEGMDCDTSSSEKGCTVRTSAGIQERGKTIQSSDYNSSIKCDSNQNTGGRRGVSVKTVTNVMSSVPATNGHSGAHSHRDLTKGRRASQGSTGQSSVPPGSVTGVETGGLPLDRLTQGKTGVVRLARTESHRREAWSIFPQEEDPRVQAERGEGHRFEPKPFTQDWCDACGRQISAQALKCQNCSYTCHLECEGRVQLDCNQRDRKLQETPSPRRHGSTPPRDKQNETKEEEGGGTKALSEEEVRASIKDYNSKVSENGMKLAADGSYTGFIKVHLRLSRPVTVPDTERTGLEAGSGLTDRHNRPVTASEGQSGADPVQSDKRTSFYLPCDCAKQLHISSATTAREVIQGLLKKFQVLDNPRKFALYRQTHRDSQDLFQKLPLCERPLSLRLIAGPDPDQLSFVLKENETNEVEWHAFSVPELQNFMVILEKEEAERVRVVEQRYSAYRQKLQQALREHDP